MTFDRFDQFESYTDKTLPDDQRRTLEQQLSGDAALRAELNDYQRFRHSIDAVKLNQQLERLHTRLDRRGALPDGPPAPPIVRPRRFAPGLVAAGVVLLLLFSYGLYVATRPTLAEQTFLAYYRAEPVARGMNACGPELAPGLRAYRAGNFGQALAVFSRLPANQPCVRYYRGLAHLALKNTPGAIVELEAAVGQGSRSLSPGNSGLSLPDLTGQKAEWYLALAYMNGNRTGDARERLTAIIRQPGHPFKTVAQNALTDLENE